MTDGRGPVADADGRGPVADAARENAAWCDLITRVHGGAGRFGPDAWTSPRRTPDLYPDAVTLVPGADGAAILARVDGSSGCSVKDSFADLDLAARGFVRLVEGTWVGRDPDALGARPHARGDGADALGARPDALRMEPVSGPAGLAAWEAAWGTGAGAPRTFPDVLLDDADVSVLAAREGGAVVAGAILYRWSGVVGISNLFAPDSLLGAAYAGAAAAARARHPGHAVVGWETGRSLEAAIAAGLAPLGPLVVWLRA